MLHSLFPFHLQFRYPFRISHGMRTHTDVVYLKLEHEGFTAWGEATLPPYLPETQQTVVDFLSLPEIKNIVAPFQPAKIFKALDKKYPGHMAAKAALDMALWDLTSKTEGKTVKELLNISSDEFPLCTYTIGVCSHEEMKEKVAFAEANGFRMYKLKLDGTKDEEMIADFKSLSDKPFAVDVNQGWKDAKQALKKIEWLAKEGCVLVEQPLRKDDWEEMKAVKVASALPVYGDESCQRIGDLEKAKDAFHGVNIKLMKCGGISEAVEMIQLARENDLKVLVGCMSESSVGCTAAAILSPLADYADLDGPYLIANDPFEGMKVEHGRISLNPLRQTQPLVSKQP